MNMSYQGTTEKTSRVAQNIGYPMQLDKGTTELPEEGSGKMGSRINRSKYFSHEFSINHTTTCSYPMTRPVSYEKQRAF